MLEGYGPGGVAVIIWLTDNRNRTAGEVRVTTKSSSSSSKRAVSFMFEHLGVIEYDAKVASADATHDDVVSSDNGHVAQDRFSGRQGARSEIRQAAQGVAGFLIRRIRSRQQAGPLKLLEHLNEHDDVQNVYANFEISDALMQRMSARVSHRYRRRCYLVAIAGRGLSRVHSTSGRRGPCAPDRPVRRISNRP